MKADEDLTPFMEPAPSPEDIAEKQLLEALNNAGDQAAWIIKDWLGDADIEQWKILAEYF